MQKILVTGGAGYIGCHAVKALCEVGYDVVVVDNLSNGVRAAVDERARLVELDLGDIVGLYALFGSERFDAVMHFAGSIEAGLSMKEPRAFFENNLVCGMNLLEAMRLGGVQRIIFSSTAAVYGNPISVPIKEDAALEPVNFYGVTKLQFENLLTKYDEFWGIKSVCLRYFNAAGADESGKIGEAHDPETHLIPLVLKGLLARREGDRVVNKLKVFGDDYDTPDGTCIRDYIHVKDLVDAHLLALKYLSGGLSPGGEISEELDKKLVRSDVFNLGNGKGFSVLEVIKAAEKVTGMRVDYEVVARREGDPAVLVADSTKANEMLGWKPVYYKLEDIIASAWRWHQKTSGGLISS